LARSTKKKHKMGSNHPPTKESKEAGTRPVVEGNRWKRRAPVGEKEQVNGFGG